MDITAAIEKVYRLNVGIIGTGNGRHERPHKPIMLLAALDMVAMDKAQPERIPWSMELRQRFSEYFDYARKENDSPTPENPFFHLKSDGFWEGIREKNGLSLPLNTTPTVADAVTGGVYARFCLGMESLVLSQKNRSDLRNALVSRYFPDLEKQFHNLFAEKESTPDPLQREESEYEVEAGKETGRSAAFRRIVIEAYDHQCAACGLRIKLPDKELSFVDGAHLIPFSKSKNDHPTNGLALCKNHHWAMDRFLIAPAPSGVWKVSALLDARRSAGERSLIELSDQTLLLPTDEAYHPHPEGLKWRIKSLLV